MTRLHFTPTQPTDPWFLRAFARVARCRFIHVGIEIDGEVLDFQPGGLFSTPASEWTAAHPGAVTLDWSAPLNLDQPVRRWWPWYNCAHWASDVLGVERCGRPDRLRRVAWIADVGYLFHRESRSPDTAADVRNLLADFYRELGEDSADGVVEQP